MVNAAHFYSVCIHDETSTAFQDSVWCCGATITQREQDVRTESRSLSL